MLHHRTTDPAVRAEHIADRLDEEHSEELLLRSLGQFDGLRCYYPTPVSAYSDWPRFWLATYDDVRRELIDPVLEPEHAAR